MRRIQIQTRGHRQGLDSDWGLSLDPRDPDILRAKAIARSLQPQASVPSRLDRKEA
jgi:hypothetical protein